MPILLLPPTTTSDIDGDLTRRRLLGAGSLLAGALLAGCADDDPGAAPAASPTPPGAGGFPVEIRHRFGVSRVDAQPERVVSVGYYEHDYAIALGVTPVAFSTRDGRQASPWTVDALAGAGPQVFSAAEVNIEAVAAQRPDLILALYSDITEDVYRRLSELAPVVGPSADYPEYGQPWQDATRMIARALGREGRGEEVIADLEGRFAQAREDHPQFVGLTAVSVYLPSAGKFGVHASADPRARFLTALGFRYPPEIDEFAQGAAYAEVSEERLSLLDHDVLLMALSGNDLGTTRETLREHPVYGRLDVVQDERDIYTGGLLRSALGAATPLSLPVALDGVLPELERATAGPTPPG